MSPTRRAIGYERLPFFNVDILINRIRAVIENTDHHQVVEVGRVKNLRTRRITAEQPSV